MSMVMSILLDVIIVHVMMATSYVDQLHVQRYHVHRRNKFLLRMNVVNIAKVMET